jgi:hypothetical protein
MKTLGRKMMIILASALFGFLGLWFLLATCLTIPGQGLESLKFIKSVEKQIDRVIPEGKYVLKYDPTNSSVSPVVVKLLMASYEAEVLSTLDIQGVDYQVAKEDENSDVYKYVEFTKEHFNNKWGDVLTNGGNIDFNAIGYDLIDLDKEIAGKFHSKSLISAGIQFLYSPNSIKAIFSKSLMEDSKNQERIMNDDDYEKAITYNRDKYTSAGMTVNSSIGTYIANNKSWFINTQRQVIGGLLSNFLVSNLAMWVKPDGTTEKAWTPDTKDNYLSTTVEVKTSDLTAPNFSGSLKLLQAGTVMTLMTPFFAAIIIPLGTLIIVWNRKN